MELRESQLVEKDAALHPDPVAEATPEEPQSWFVRMESTMLSAMASKKTTRSSRRARPQPRA